MWINRDTEAQRRVRYLYIVQIALTLKFQKRRTRERQIVRRDNKGYVSRNRSPTRDACVPLSWLPNQVRPQRSIVVFGERGWEAEKNICQPSFFSRRHTRFFPSVTPNVFPDVTPGFISSVALDFIPDLTPDFFQMSHPCRRVPAAGKRRSDSAEAPWQLRRAGWRETRATTTSGSIPGRNATKASPISSRGKASHSNTSVCCLQRCCGDDTIPFSQLIWV